MGETEGQADLHLEMGTAASNEKGRGPMHTLTATHSQALGLPLSKLAAVYASRPFSSYHHAYSLALNPETPTHRARPRSRPRACMLGRVPRTAETLADLAEHSMCEQQVRRGEGGVLSDTLITRPRITVHSCMPLFTITRCMRMFGWVRCRVGCVC